MLTSILYFFFDILYFDRVESNTYNIKLKYNTLEIIFGNSFSKIQLQGKSIMLFYDNKKTCGKLPKIDQTKVYLAIYLWKSTMSWGICSWKIRARIYRYHSDECFQVVSSACLQVRYVRCVNHFPSSANIQYSNKGVSSRLMKKNKSNNYIN